MRSAVVSLLIALGIGATSCGQATPDVTTGDPGPQPLPTRSIPSEFPSPPPDDGLDVSPLAAFPNPRMDFVSASEGWAIAGSGPDVPGRFQSAAPGTQIEHTDDAGRSWSTQLVDAGGVWGVWAADDHDAWAVGENTLSRTVDAGRTWTAVAEPPEALVAVDFGDAPNGVGITRSGSLYLSSNDGESWGSLSRAPEHVESACLSSQGWIATTQLGAVYRSFDRGSSWDLMLSALNGGRLEAHLYCAGTTVWLLLNLSAQLGSTPYVLLRSDDLARSWQTVADARPQTSRPLGDEAASLAAAAVFPDGALTVVEMGQGAETAFVDDLDASGTAGQPQQLPVGAGGLLRITAIAQSSGKLWVLVNSVGGQDGTVTTELLSSVDSGRTWDTLGDPASSSAASPGVSESQGVRK